MKLRRVFALTTAFLLSLALIPAGLAATPTAQSATVYTLANTPYTFTGKEFTFSEAATLSKIKLDRLPTAPEGSLTLDGTAVTVDQEISAADLTAKKLVFTPALSLVNKAQFTFTAYITPNDTFAGYAAVTVELYKAPTVTSETIYVQKNKSYSGTAKATEVQGLPLSFFITSNPSHGKISFTSNGAYSYTPDTDYVGTDSFTFKAYNGYFESGVATITTVIDARNAPKGDNQTFHVNMATTTSLAVIARDTNSPALPLTYKKLTDPKKGKLTFNADGTFVYKHDSGLLGKDYFTYEASNGFAATGEITVTLIIEMPEPINYVDMQQNAAKEEAGMLANMNLVWGDKIQDRYYFRPTEFVTRADFVIMLNSIMEYTLDKTDRTIFADVERPHEITAINTAFENGAVSGTGGGKFKPETTIRRSEAVKMLGNALSFKTHSTAPTVYSDEAEIPEWAIQEVRDLLKNGILTDMNGLFRPAESLTRAEAAMLLYNTYMYRKS